MVQSSTQRRNALHELGYKIFLDRYAQKDMTRSTLAVGDTVIVVVNSETGQREIGTVKSLELPQVTIELLDGEVVTRDVEHVDKPLETDPAQMMERVARGIAAIEKSPELQAEWTEKFQWLLDDFKFVPAGRILTAAGTNQALTFYNCFVLPSPKDSRGGIIETLRQMTEIMSRGGGVGINISSLRPRHGYVKGVNGRSSGSVSWGALYSFVTGLIEQGGCFGPDERIMTDVGLIPAKELADRMDAGETFFAHTHKGLRRITARFRNGVKPLYEVTTKRGYKVRITEEHKVAVLMDGKITTMPLKYLQQGDEILLLLGSGIQTRYVELKPVDYQRSVMSTTLNENVRLPELLTEELAYLIGYMHGDGYVHIGKKVNWQAPKAVKMATDDKYPQIRERLVESIRHIFNVEPTIENGDGACKNVALHSRLVVEWLITNGLLKAKADSIRVPEAIFHSPSSVQGAFIAGYFDADGCNRGRKGGYGIDCINRPMLADVQQLLAVNGIVSRISATDRSEQGWQTIYRLSVTGNRFKRRFAAFVPAEKVSADANGKREETTYPIAAWKAIGARDKYRQRVHDGVSERISFAQLERIGERLEADGQELHAQQIRELLNTVPDEITSIEPSGDSEVYDFEVDDVHLLSGSGVYTSNSRRGALMLILNDWHPDIFDFINSKRTAGRITNANISVGVSDKLMEAVKVDGDWDLVFPDTAHPAYDAEWDGELEKWLEKGYPVIKHRTVKAREVWNAITESAWASAEPGVWFRERSNKMSNSWYFNPLIATNPCVTGDTLISTARGLIRAEELFDSEEDVEAVIDSRFGYEQQTSKASRVFLTGRKPVFRLQTKEGYFIRATADHRIMTSDGWVELRDLRPGDRIHILNRKGGFGVEGSLELGRVLGWVVGDGTIKRDQVVRPFFGEEKRELAPQFAEYVNTLVAPLTLVKNRTYTVGAVEVAERDEVRVGSTRLREIAAQYGLTEIKHRVPEVVFKGSEDMQRGFLQALFTADGSFQDGGEKGGSVRLAANQTELLEGVQQLLLNFGIASRIYRNRRQAGYRQMPDANRELKPYWCEARHELVISKRNMNVFADEIGFLMGYKQNALLDYISRGKQGTYSESFTATVESITEDGVEDVFDLTEPLTHSFVGNGIVLHNCGEQSLAAWSVCNLGAINLARFYDEDKQDVKWDDLDTAVRYAVRFLDNVIDSTPYFFEENAKQQLSERRVGLNNMGLAELMIRLGIRYGSDESVEFIDKLYSFIARAAYETSIELAQEKGPFPQFDGEKFIQSGFMQSMPKDIREKVRKKGIRNVTLLTQAPTGTTGTMVNTSTGIEPFFSWVYYRKSRLGLHEEQVPLVKEWYEKHPGETKLPDYFVTAMDLTPEEHVKVQAAIQRWVDSSISKCVVGDTLILTDEGLQAIEELSDWREPDSFSPLHVGVMTSKGSAVASAFYYNGMRPTIKVKLSYGYGLEGTTNHPIRVLQPDGTITFKQLGDLRIGDVVPVYMGQRKFGRPNKPLPAYEGNWDVTNTKHIQIPTHMTNELAYLLGCIISEGSIGRNTVHFVNSDRRIVEDVARLFEDIFGIQCLIEQDKRRDNLWYVRANSRVLCRWLTAELGLMVGASNKTIPACILTASAEEIAHFLRGLFLDAYVTLDGRMFGIGLASLKLLQQLQVLFLNFGIVSRLHKAGPKAWALTVAGESLDKLAQITVFEEVWKNERIARRNEMRVMKKYRDYANYLPATLSHELYQAVKTHEQPLRSLYPDRADDYQRVRVALMKKTKIRRDDAREVYSAFSETSSDYLNNFFASDSEQCIYLEVKELQAGFAEVFDITVPDSHEFIANGICNHNTANLPNSYTVEQTRKLYEYMYELGCKGGTVYRDGSRDEQVLMLKGDERAESELEKNKPAQVEQVTTPHYVYPRPKKLTGVTVNCKTPYGTAYITMNTDEQGHPFEVFITAPGKAGSDLHADAEGIGRLISLQLRTTAPQNRMQMIKLVIDQLKDIRGSRSYGMGPNRVFSLPDAVAGALLDHFFPQDKAQQLNLFVQPELMGMNGSEDAADNEPEFKGNGNGHAHGHLVGADICPSCGTISLLHVEGCKKCLTCGYSEC